jgi:hypothetical protein
VRQGGCVWVGGVSESGNKTAVLTAAAWRVPRTHGADLQASVSQHLAETAAMTRQGGHAASERPGAG